VASLWEEVQSRQGIFKMITLCSRVILQDLTVVQLVKKFPTIYGTMFTREGVWFVS
jgi:hypothetical protein